MPEVMHLRAMFDRDHLKEGKAFGKRLRSMKMGKVGESHFDLGVSVFIIDVRIGDHTKVIDLMEEFHVKRAGCMGSEIECILDDDPSVIRMHLLNLK